MHNGESSSAKRRIKKRNVYSQEYALAFNVVSIYVRTHLVRDTQPQ
jgi:hypothetical protein